MQEIAGQNMPVEIFDINSIHVSHILPSLWKNQGVIICAPTYETALFPFMVDVLNMAKIKGTNRTAAYFGSYGWGSIAKKQFESYCTDQKWDVIENFQFYGKPKSGRLRNPARICKKVHSSGRIREIKYRWRLISSAGKKISPADTVENL